MFRSISLAALVLTVAGIHTSAQVPTLQGRVKALGRDLSSELRPNYPEPDFQRLVMESDMIIVGTIKYGVPVVTNEGAILQTDYHVAVRRVIRQNAVLVIAAGDTVIARRLGGVTTMEGFNVTMTEVGFPRFNTGETYVLFLTKEPGAAQLTLRYGGQNAFLVTADNNVRQVALNNLGTWNRDRGVVSLPAFLNEVQTIISSAR